MFGTAHMFATPSNRFSTRLAATEARRQLMTRKGYSADELPTAETIANKLNKLPSTIRILKRRGMTTVGMVIGKRPTLWHRSREIAIVAFMTSTLPPRRYEGVFPGRFALNMQVTLTYDPLHPESSMSLGQKPVGKAALGWSILYPLLILVGLIICSRFLFFQ
jgi:hypothetical protein